MELLRIKQFAYQICLSCNFASQLRKSFKLNHQTSEMKISLTNLSSWIFPNVLESCLVLILSCWGIASYHDYWDSIYVLVCPAKTWYVDPASRQFQWEPPSNHSISCSLTIQNLGAICRIPIKIPRHLFQLLHLNCSYTSWPQLAPNCTYTSRGGWKPSKSIRIPPNRSKPVPPLDTEVVVRLGVSAAPHRYPRCYQSAFHGQQIMSISSKLWETHWSSTWPQWK